MYKRQVARLPRSMDVRIRGVYVAITLGSAIRFQMSPFSNQTRRLVAAHSTNRPRRLYPLVALANTRPISSDTLTAVRCRAPISMPSEFVVLRPARAQRLA